MAPIPNKNVNPVVAVIANWLCLSILGYALIGQNKKMGYVFAAVFVGSMCCVIPGTVLAIASLVDVYKCAEAVSRGEAVDENEYRVELLHKVISFIDKSATLKA